MTNKNKRIVFLGTPDFAVESLKVLFENKYNIVGVVTSPDKPAGRGRKINESAVKKFAKSHNINVLQPRNLKAEDFQTELKALNAELFIVIAFRMLPKSVWQMPPLGTINLHASLLPQYRGAAPINHAIINGEKTTGLTTFFIDEEIDTGNILFQKEVNINDNETAGSLHDKLMAEGSMLCLHTVNAVFKNDYELKPQKQFNINSLNFAPKIFKEDCQVNWDDGCKKIYNFIRGLSPYPAAFTVFRNSKDKSFSIKLFETEILEKADEVETASIISDGKTFFRIAAHDGIIDIKSLQLAGKKRMNVTEFLRGFQNQITDNMVCLSPEKK